MKNLIFSVLAILTSALVMPVSAESLVLLHTNDTHSQIDPDEKGIGGVLQRKALIDSIRSAEDNVILIDAGDVVQGSLFFKFFKGEVEYPLMDMMNYDIRILGNHEFDNGISDIAKYYKQIKGAPISANYDFRGTELDGIFSPYVVKDVKGKKIGFFGINIDPASLIDEHNTGGLKFKEIIPVANETAAFLKKKLKCDIVVAVTHIGVDKKNAKTTDYDLAKASKDIDIIIGGHSHTVITPGETGDYPSIVTNASGKPVLVAQTGKYGRNLGYIKIDLDKPGNARKFDYRLIPVTDRFSADKLDNNIIEFLAPYRAAVDSINNNVIAQSAGLYNNDDRNGALANFTADLVYDYGKHKADSLRLTNPSFPEIDFAFMNVGGIRMPMKEGAITEGQIMNTYPFSNHLAIATIKGSDLAKALQVAAGKGGESVSSQILVVTDSNNNIEEIFINGYPLVPDRYYNFISIDYVLRGNDDLVTMANSNTLWTDEVEAVAPILNYVMRMGRAGITITPDTRKRFVVKK